MDQHGADALRWFMLCSGSPWAARRVGHAALEEIVRKVLLTYWNTASFFTLYADARRPGRRATPVADVADRPLLDRWALSELHRTVAEVDAAMEDFDTARAGRRLAAFIDDLSNWYVRRSRRRFWDGDPARRWRPCTSAWRCSPGCWRRSRRSSPTTSGGRCCRPRRTCPTRCTCATGRRSTTTLLDPVLAGADGAGAPAGRARAGRPGPRRGADPAAARPGPGRRAPAGPRCPTSCAEQVADELNVQRLEDLSASAADLVDVHGQAQLPGAGQAVRLSRPSWSPRPSRPPTPAELAARASARVAVTVDAASWARWSSPPRT